MSGDSAGIGLRTGKYKESQVIENELGLNLPLFISPTIQGGESSRILSWRIR
jgi:hypothetical protein